MINNKKKKKIASEIDISILFIVIMDIDSIDIINLSFYIFDLYIRIKLFYICLFSKLICTFEHVTYDSFYSEMSDLNLIIDNLRAKLNE